MSPSRKLVTPLVAREQIDERGLAATVRTEDHPMLPCPDLPVDVVENQARAAFVAEGGDG